MGKYPISRELAAYANFTPPIWGAKMAGWMGAMMRPPKWFWKDPEIKVTKTQIPGYRAEAVDVFVAEPKEIDTENCLVYYHGGGFFFEAAQYHYQLVKQYALRTPCKVIFVVYRRTPRHPFPVPAEDCYAALLWTMEHAQILGVRREKIAVGGDSAGGALAAAVTLMARDRIGFRPRFQLLVYPVTDRRMSSSSYRRFADTPMWNSRLSKIMYHAYLPEPNVADIIYASPIEAEDHSDLPPAYIETAEFDCLHDDGIGYAEKLQNVDVPVVLNETKGTMHGFDIVQEAPTVKKIVAQRIAYMRSQFDTL